MHALLLIMAAGAVELNDPKVDFDTEIIPVLTRAGCNTGACHGASVGRGGLRLSLYGSDPEFDYRSMVLELEGRRVNLSHPDDSLLLLKATESINHGGGHRLDPDDAGAALLRTWILEGALRAESSSLREFRVSPASYVADSTGSTIRLKSMARFSGQLDRDVTEWTVFTPEDLTAIEIDSETAIATVHRRGRHIVVARYLDHVVPLEIAVPFSDSVIDHSNEPRHNFIDKHVIQMLETLRLPVSPLADDSAFLRRVTIDLTGRLPLPSARSEYLADRNPRKRAALVERLLSSDEFTEYWTLRFAKLLRIRSQPGDVRGALTYYNWLKGQIADHVPYDQVARELLVASGDTHHNGPANFYRTESGPRMQAEFASELFMGTRLRCANCHNHPLDRWTQDDYHGLSAIFAKVNHGRVIKVSASGEVTHPRTGEAVVPRIPGVRFLHGADDGRMEMARWLTDPKNPFFAKATVNRLWKAMMGRGLVEPTDDLRATNPATHQPLLDQLADDFIENGYDLRNTIRLIAQSSTYGRSALPLRGNRFDDHYYSHTLTRLLEPEVLADAIADVTGIADQYGDYAPGTRAVSLFDSRIESETLDVLGRCSRTESCESSEQSAEGLTLKLHLLNGPLLNSRITHPDGRLTQLIDAGSSPEDVIEILYVVALSRKPSIKEKVFWTRQFAEIGNQQQRRQVLEDVLWSLLTCREFLSNH